MKFKIALLLALLGYSASADVGGMADGRFLAGLAEIAVQDCNYAYAEKYYETVGLMLNIVSKAASVKGEVFDRAALLAEAKTEVLAVLAKNDIAPCKAAEQAAKDGLVKLR